MPRHSGGGGGGGGGGDDYEDDDYDTDGSPMVSSIGGNVWAQGSEILQSTSEVIRSHSPLIVLVCRVLLSFSLFLTQSNVSSKRDARYTRAREREGCVALRIVRSFVRSFFLSFP